MVRLCLLQENYVTHIVCGRMSLERTLTFYTHNPDTLPFSTCCLPSTFTDLSVENFQPFPIHFAGISETSN